MEAKAILRNARTSPYKARLVADQIRGMPIERVLDTLAYSLKKTGGIVKKVVDSAIANAEHNFSLDIDELRVSQIYVDEGPMYKRMQPRAKGRGNQILKRTCHITVVVSDGGVSR